MEHSKLPWKMTEVYSNKLDRELFGIENTDGEFCNLYSPWLDDEIDKANAAFIVKVCNHFDELREALEFYANKDNYKGNEYCPPYNGWPWTKVDEDDGERARLALKNTEAE